MITGRTLMEHGWPQGKAIGFALGAAEELAKAGLDEEAILQELERVRQNPVAGGSPGRVTALAEELRRVEAQGLADELKEEPGTYAMWGSELIEEGTDEQMKGAMSLSVSVASALMPDAHLSYGLPVGGVLATDGVVIPWAVGVDIFEASPGLLDERRGELVEILLRNTNFSAGGSYKEGRRGMDHEVLDDPAWRDTPFLKELRDTAQAQLGTSGSGNHFVEWGVTEDLETGEERLSLLSHSGSRGVLQDRQPLLKIAKQKHPKLDKRVADLSWLELSSEEGEEYWLSMQLAGRFASANHEVIHEKIARALGADLIEKVENHHNFAWREELDGREVIVHRKGTTPASEGVMGVIPGSMGDPGYVVRGKGYPASIHSASHGAGRLMSRRRAFQSVPEEEWRRYMEERGVTLIGGALDEAPQAYEPIEEVIGFQGDLVDVVGRFTPKLVRMDQSPEAAAGKRVAGKQYTDPTAVGGHPRDDPAEGTGGVGRAEAHGVGLMPLSTRASRETHYAVANPYHRFWLRFVGSNMAEIERGHGDLVVTRIREDWSTYRGRPWSRWSGSTSSACCPTSASETRSTWAGTGRGRATWRWT